jgi:glycosyltransferase involved in cell wall biosynthesis
MKILFIGFNHLPKDPRLFHREMYILNKNNPEIELYFAKNGKVYTYKELSNYKQNNFQGRKNILKGGKVNKIIRRLAFLKRKILNLYYNTLVFWKVKELRPDVIQASDAREILFTLLGKFFFGCRIVYDSHEDYFRQVVDYGDRHLISYFRAFPLSMCEMIFLRFFDCIFCTDDFLYQKYRKSIYKCKRVFLLRNFPIIESGEIDREFINKDNLELVYIGGVNKKRGVIEVAKYVLKYNIKHHEKKLKFHVYSCDNELLDKLEKECSIIRHEYVDYEMLMKELKKYDIGVCLWNDIPKFRRNLPLKNFDYMAVGLPIITSNFGNLKKYAEESGAAFCIDPMSYDEFESAINMLFDQRLRQKMGLFGRGYVERVASFNCEAKSYIENLEKLSTLLSGPA